MEISVTFEVTSASTAERMGTEVQLSSTLAKHKPKKIHANAKNAEVMSKLLSSSQSCPALTHGHVDDVTRPGSSVYEWGGIAEGLVEEHVPAHTRIWYGCLGHQILIEDLAQRLTLGTAYDPRLWVRFSEVNARFNLPAYGPTLYHGIVVGRLGSFADL
ncbi:hypothetical protein VNO77_37314 [Canavalia gladiata]|uniref:Uncharacterized protein n=1 Tax=Canavalia gladiata TaxID=3824 RepID=A0AAN9KBZ3_CANGL